MNALSPETPWPLICICGPTGAGKTDLSLLLAHELPKLLPDKIFGCEIINADSRQLYADFPIITAQPSAQEQLAAPHRLFGFLDSQTLMSAGNYAALATSNITNCRANCRQNEKNTLPSLPILVGGTGFYIRSLLEGIAYIPPVPPEVSVYWRGRCEAEGAAALHGLLEEVDPALVARLHPNDKQRIIRGLEVYTASGKPLSVWQTQTAPLQTYKTLKIGVALDLKELEPRLAVRIDKMLELGAIEEARQAKARCPNPTAPGWSGIGCAELWRYLAGELSLEECKSLWLANTRAYAKRQLTWFRSDPEIIWLKPQDHALALEHALKALSDN